jgi:hypothetical protein
MIPFHNFNSIFYHIEKEEHARKLTKSYRYQGLQDTSKEWSKSSDPNNSKKNKKIDIKKNKEKEYIDIDFNALEIGEYCTIEYTDEELKIGKVSDNVLAVYSQE